MKKKGLYLELFLSTLYLSIFTFGGGYVIVSMMKQKFCDELHYIDEQEMLDLVAIAQSAPGAIAVNGAIVLGYKMAGLKGVLICILGTVIPPFTIISIISLCYEAFIANEMIKNLLIGMRAGVGALIVSTVYDMFMGMMDQNKYRNILLMMATFVLNYCLKVNIGFIVLGCIVLALLSQRFKKEMN